MKAYLAHPLADAEGLKTLTPRLAIFPTGSIPHRDMQTALTNRHLLTCIQEGKPLPEEPPVGMTPDKYAEYQAIVQHTSGVPDDIVAKSLYGRFNDKDFTKSLASSNHHGF